MACQWLGKKTQAVSPALEKAANPCGESLCPEKNEESPGIILVDKVAN